MGLGWDILALCAWMEGPADGMGAGAGAGALPGLTSQDFLNVQ